MYCKYCGSQLSEEYKFCSACGAKNEDYKQPKDEVSSVNPTAETNESDKESEAIEKIFESTNNTQTENNSLENQAPAEHKKFSGFAIASFVLSLVGIIVAGIPCGILSIVFSSIALNQVKVKNLKGKGLAIAGLVIGIIDFILVLSYL